MPAALLEFSRSIMRARFSAIIVKPVYTFTFDRFTQISPALLRKLEMAVARRAVVCSTPTAVKAIMLKFVEILHRLDSRANVEHQAKPSTALSTIKGALSKFGKIAQAMKSSGHKRGHSREDGREPEIPLEEQVQTALKIFDLFRNGTLIMDEVDLILHPLKSEYVLLLSLLNTIFTCPCTLYTTLISSIDSYTTL
jgi:AAA15 family ATPase/GTPase